MSSEIARRIQEREANLFAVFLLMPEDLLREALEKYPLDLSDDTNFKKIAQRFQVTHTALAYRLAQLKTSKDA